MDNTQVSEYNQLCTKYSELIERSSSSQEELDKVFYEILSLFRSITANITASRPTHWAPVWHQLEVEKNMQVINSVREKNNKLFEAHREKIKREEFMKADPNHPKLKKIDELLVQLKIKMKKT